MKLIYWLLVSMILLVACEKESAETKTFIVADHRADCISSGPQKCLLIKETPVDDWMFFYDRIEGFDYEEGFEYKLEVWVYKVSNPPADGSSKRYVLKSVISKK